MKPKLVIWGCSGHALVVADIIRLCDNYEIVGFLDDVNPDRWGTSFCNSKVLGGQDQLESLKEQGVGTLIFGFGDCRSRLRLAKITRSMGFNLATAIHPSSVVANDVIIGEGTVIVAGAVINPGSYLGENVIINTCASIDHECWIGNGAHISPGAHLAGRIRIGEAAWIGIGAILIEKVNIGSGAQIGAGAVVINDIPADALAYGVPARVVKKGL